MIVICFLSLVIGVFVGIGDVFVCVLVVWGYDLVLVVWCEECLQILVDELQCVYGNCCYVMVVDLFDLQVFVVFCDEFQLCYLQVDWLINNVGYGLFGMLVVNLWLVYGDFIQVMMIVFIELVW